MPIVYKIRDMLVHCKSGLLPGGTWVAESKYNTCDKTVRAGLSATKMPSPLSWGTDRLESSIRDLRGSFFLIGLLSAGWCLLRKNVLRGGVQGRSVRAVALWPHLKSRVASSVLWQSWPSLPASAGGKTTRLFRRGTALTWQPHMPELIPTVELRKSELRGAE